MAFEWLPRLGSFLTLSGSFFHQVGVLTESDVFCFKDNMVYIYSIFHKTLAEWTGNSSEYRER